MIMKIQNDQFSTGNKSVDAPLYVRQHQFSCGLISGRTQGFACERSGDSARGKAATGRLFATKHMERVCGGLINFEAGVIHPG
jgi:hypothetical protein